MTISIPVYIDETWKDIPFQVYGTRIDKNGFVWLFLRNASMYRMIKKPN